MNVRPVRTRIFKEGEDLAAFITKHIPKLKEGSIVAVASKIVALSEGRTTEVKSEKERERLIRSESSWMRHVFGKWWLTVREGVVIVNAGIDESNSSDGKLILLPKDSMRAAREIRAALRKKYRVKRLGVVITDSRVAPLRAGVTGVALGYAGFRGVRDYRGKKDLFGRTMDVTRTNVADSLATAATLVMGEGSERQPLAVITDAPVAFADRIDHKETRIPMRQDMYRALFRGKQVRKTKARG
ncbi:MAG: coenzyme F420-0:L-glutamate ligase [Patescibacteria group bacterium]|nr:coenzyme F420-0:L-glutamate ligase [bacterium]MDZ4227118.1 coenzyme F420-0:L-glutamate ligase [Patescibacteria group bacterium]